MDSLQNDMSLVRVSKGVTDTDRSVIVPSQLINIVSGVPEVSCFVDEEPGKISFERVGIKSSVSETFGK